MTKLFTCHTFPTSKVNVEGAMSVDLKSVQITLHLFHHRRWCSNTHIIQPQFSRLGTSMALPYAIFIGGECLSMHWVGFPSFGIIVEDKPPELSIPYIPNLSDTIHSKFGKVYPFNKCNTHQYMSGVLPSWSGRSTLWPWLINDWRRRRLPDLPRKITWDCHMSVGIHLFLTVLANGVTNWRGICVLNFIDSGMLRAPRPIPY